VRAGGARDRARAQAAGERGAAARASTQPVAPACTPGAQHGAEGGATLLLACSEHQAHSGERGLFVPGLPVRAAEPADTHSSVQGPSVAGASAATTACAVDEISSAAAAIHANDFGNVRPARMRAVYARCAAGARTRGRGRKRKDNDDPHAQIR